MYDAISKDYDRFVNWPARLAVELPFILKQLINTVGSTGRVLDTACGTGMHAISLAQHGFHVTGADLSQGMIDRARVNAEQAGVNVNFEVIGFQYLPHAFGKKRFDALLCLGNSLPHILELSELATTLVDFADCLRPGGILVLQNRNFDAIMSHRERWMEPQAYRDAEAEWLFFRFYDFDADGLISFNIVTMYRQGMNPWSHRVTATRLYPLRQKELNTALGNSGFINTTAYGNMSDTPFDPETSGNLVIVTHRGEKAL
jgi:glycine/sarcosine N-methyltransferase